MRKKGGFQLSINAVVVLIIALVALGFAIFFTRGTFEKAQETTYKALTAQETKVPASADKPLIADKEVVVTGSDPVAIMDISIYNTNAVPAQIFLGLESCIDTSSREVLEKIDFSGIKGDVTLSPASFGGYQTILRVNKIGSEIFTNDIITCKIKVTYKNEVWAEGSEPSHETSFVIFIKDYK